jgi:hypothetical protein
MWALTDCTALADAHCIGWNTNTTARWDGPDLHVSWVSPPRPPVAAWHLPERFVSWIGDRNELYVFGGMSSSLAADTTSTADVCVSAASGMQGQGQGTFNAGESIGEPKLTNELWVLRQPASASASAWVLLGGGPSRAVDQHDFSPSGVWAGSTWQLDLANANPELYHPSSSAPGIKTGPPAIAWPRPRAGSAIWNPFSTTMAVPSPDTGIRMEGLIFSGLFSRPCFGADVYDISGTLPGDFFLPPNDLWSFDGNALSWELIGGSETWVHQRDTSQVVGTMFRGYTITAQGESDSEADQLMDQWPIGRWGAQTWMLGDTMYLYSGQTIFAGINESSIGSLWPHFAGAHAMRSLMYDSKSSLSAAKPDLNHDLMRSEAWLVLGFTFLHVLFMAELCCCVFGLSSFSVGVEEATQRRMGLRAQVQSVIKSSRRRAL